MSVFMLSLSMLFTTEKLFVKKDEFIVSFGFISYSVPIIDISEVLDDTLHPLKQGGYGIRMSNFEGRRKLSFLTFSGKKVMLSLNEGKYAHLSFSTRKPEDVKSALKQAMKKE